jgi:hypothetical protein
VLGRANGLHDVNFLQNELFGGGVAGDAALEGVEGPAAVDVLNEVDEGVAALGDLTNDLYLYEGVAQQNKCQGVAKVCRVVKRAMRGGETDLLAADGKRRVLRQTMLLAHGGGRGTRTGAEGRGARGKPGSGGCGGRNLWRGDETRRLLAKTRRN